MSNSSPLPLALLCSFLIAPLACGDGRDVPEQKTPEIPGDGDGDPGSEGDGTGDGDGDGDGDGSGDGDGDGDESIYFDVGVGNGDASNGDGNPDDTCAAVDLLFVIDNSGSMADEQAKLVANFPLFAEEIQTTLAEVDGYHVGVVTSDDYWNLFASPGINSDAPDCRVLGGLVTSTAQGNCAPFAEGHRFMTEADDLGSSFACAATVGDTGLGIEKMGAAASAAVLPALNSPGQCNEGFIRNDALLVIVMITDENDDVESGTTPSDWYDSVVAAKLNLPDNIVVLSLIWDDRNGNPDGCVADTDEEVGYAIEEFTNMFTHGSLGSVCADSYAQFFSDAISVIDTACDDFEPPA
jgi:hypothetical protein